MKDKEKVILYSFLATLVCMGVALFILKPVWTALDLHVPENPTIKIDFTQPVDSIFYIQNAESGYIWNVKAKTSLWFHPLLSWAIRYIPIPVTANYRLWIISLISTFLSIAFVYEYVIVISSVKLQEHFLIFALFLPGGLGMATGNAEILCLFFNSLLMLSILRKSLPYYPLLFGTLAILTKPNALYMVPALGIYFVYAYVKKDYELLQKSLIGIISIIITWLLWILFVDIKVGDFGAYWKVRSVSTVPLTAGPLSLIQRTARVFVFSENIGDKLKFATALVIPLIDMWLLLVIPLKSEIHRLSILASILTMLFITFAMNNPNKIIVYATTLPGHLAIGLLFTKQTFQINSNERMIEKIMRHSAGVAYLIFCALMVFFFVLGTPLEWYD